MLQLARPYRAVFTRRPKSVTVPSRRKSIHTVVLVRHGQSLWNKDNRYSGWCDLPLTDEGEADAFDAGIAMMERKLEFDVAFTSRLERAWRTCALLLSQCKNSDVETIRSSKLNERHYGALQGHRKDSPEIRAIFGDKTLDFWRRSYLGVPPSMYDVEFLSKVGVEGFLRSTSNMNSAYLDWDRVGKIKEALATHDPDALVQLRRALSQTEMRQKNHASIAPTTESLKMCGIRAYKYWQDVIVPRVLSGDRVVVVAHANTIRALVKSIDNIPDHLIPQLKIPNGIPLMYKFDDDMKPIDESDGIGFRARYIVTARNYEKVLRFESSERKKLQGIFEFLDADGDGTITPHETLSRITHLRNTGGEVSIHEMGGTVGMRYQRNVVADRKQWGNTSVYDHYSASEARVPIDFCEYEVQELFRCIPESATSGRITKEQFMDAAHVMLPRLSRFKLYSHN